MPVVLSLILPLIATPVGEIPPQPSKQSITKTATNPSPWSDAICTKRIKDDEMMLHCFTPTLQLNGIAEGYFPLPDNLVEKK